MDNEKLNELEVNTPNKEAEENTPMTADELIRRLKLNLKQNTGNGDGDASEPEKSENQELGSGNDDEAVEIEASDEDEVQNLEEAAEEVEPAVRKRKTNISDTIKSLIASIKSGEELKTEEVVDEESAEEAEVSEVKAEEVFGTVAEDTVEYSVEAQTESEEAAEEFIAVEEETAENEEATEELVEEYEEAQVAGDEAQPEEEESGNILAKLFGKFFPEKEKTVKAPVEEAVEEETAEEIFNEDTEKVVEEAAPVVELTEETTPVEEESENVFENINEIALEETSIKIGELLIKESKEKSALEASEELTPDEEQPVAEEPAPVTEKAYSVLIENSSDKTNVFEPGMIKKGRKARKTDNLFKENESPAVVEAEQLTFSMTEDDLQKSIEEAEAFIFDRPHVEDPADVINDDNAVSSENLLSDDNEKAEKYDETDLWIASAFGDEDEVKKKFGEEEAQKIETQLDLDVQEYLKTEKKDVKIAKIADEYTSPSQKKDIFAAYRKMHKTGLLKIAACFLLMIVALIYENLSTFGGNLPGALNQNNYPVVYILGSLQILVLAGAVAWTEISRGIKAIWAMKPLPESITATVVIASAFYHIAHCFISETDPDVALYMFPVVIFIFVTLIYDHFNLRREIYSFNIVASKRIKYTITPVESGKANLENEAFSEYLAEEDEVSMFRIGKTGFVNGFSERINSYSKSNSIITILLSLAIALGLVFFIVSTVVYDAKTAFSFAYLAFLVAVPCCALLSFSLPFYRASKKAFEDDSAIIGDVSLDEYSKASTLSFDDKDVFPSYGVKVKSIKVYGDSRIDKILYNSASVFKVIGGPLADVFDTATHELGKSDNMEIIEIAKDGIESLIDGSHVYIGKASYLKAHGYLPVSDTDDDILETSGDASIMYMVCDDVVSAKMYIQYTIDPDFEFALRRLYKAGICIGIKTFDPNIDDKLLGSKVKITKYPVRILRCKTLEEATEPQEEANSGIVSKGSPRSLLNAFVLCSKVLFANRTNITAKILSVAFSVVLMSFFLMFSSITAIPSLYVALYQVFWMVPVYLISKFYV